jgi:RimJ/RimL family protein N-acetyltransferase
VGTKAGLCQWDTIALIATDMTQGYIYSVFNLVYETNVASIKIWESLGFERIGRVKRCGNLKSHPGKLIDAIVFGRDL